MTRIKRSVSKVAFTIAFSLMFSLYLYDFESGASSGGVLLRILLKCASIGLLVYKDSSIKIEKHLVPLLLILNLALFSIILTFPFLTSRDLQWINQLIVIPLLFWSPKMSLEEFKNYFLKIYFIWMIVDLCVLYSDRSLWLNKAFVGGIGNPSSFGLFSILTISIGYFDRRYFYVFFGLIGLVMSKALMPVIAFLVVFVASMNYRVKFIAILILPFLALIIDSFASLIPPHLLFKIDGLVSFIRSGDYKDLASIGTRLEFFEQTKSSLSNTLTFLFGKYDGNYYYSGDSLWLTYLTSFGVPITLGFLYSIFCIYRDVIRRSKDMAVVVFLWAVFFMFITNRILDYWPVFLVVIFFIKRLYYESSHS